ncbi:hypothetical protein BDF14DRAFT_1835905 [Spinellus fusiger]|nr:hypothetical protein BDF14DRAFT_1835905 [Spinellus fusiger]
MQRISSCLANDIARSLSFHDPTLSSTPSAEESRLHKDQDMLHSSSTSFHPRVYRKWTHSQLSHSMNGHSTPYQEISPTEEHSFSPLPTLRRISLSGALNLSSDMDLEKWLMMQAHQQHMSVSAYKALFQEKKQQLHTCLHTLHTLNIHHPGLDITDQYEEIKATLGRILNIADELSGDHLLSFANGGNVKAILGSWHPMSSP